MPDFTMPKDEIARIIKEHKMLREAIEMAPTPFAVYDDEDMLVAWNPAYEGIHPHVFEKYKRDSGERLSYSDVVRITASKTMSDDELEAHVLERVKRQRAENITTDVREYPNGGWHQVTKYITNSNAVCGFAMDINELRQRELEAEEAQSRLQDAITNLDDGFVIFDKDDRLVVCNEVFRQQFGDGAKFLVKGETFENMTTKIAFSGFIPNIEGKETEFVDNLIKQRNSDVGLSKTFQRHDGEWIRQRDKRTPSGDLVGVRTNITELKEREHDLEEATKIAEGAERAKSEFLANMSHEIRTPMNGVMGMAELLATTDLNAKQAMFTDVIVKSGSSLLTIINDILDFSKIDAGQMELDPAPFQLAEAIEDVATLVSSKVAEKDLELIVRVDPRLPDMIVGDVGRIRQIVTNLLGNAVKFTEKGHVYVNVDGQIIKGGDGDVVKLKFSIEDTGIGIPQKQCSKVFQKFSQVDTSATRKHEGTGLGLSISSSLVQLMNGEIGVESKVGQGSTFWFEVELPIHGEMESERIIPGDLSGARILIIDDNEVNRSILTEQMAVWNFDSAATSGGLEGLSVMRAALNNGVNLDLVILDYQMPEMDGAEVLRVMREDKALSNLPVVMLTSVDSSQTNQELNRLGAEANLTKPTRSSLLLETILQVMANKRASFVAEKKIAQEQPAQANTQVPPISEVTQQLDILVAEDNEVNQIVFRQILEESNLNFKIVENGRLALAAFKVAPPQMILMDVSMPEMNGKEATSAIRKYEVENKMTRTPIIGVTAHALKGDMESCIDAGMDDYLSKPVSPNKLLLKIEQWLKMDLKSSNTGKFG